jgi:capsular polysaccharide biosynthesis protein
VTMSRTQRGAYSQIEMDADRLSLSEIVDILRRRLWLLVLVMIITVGGGVGFTLMETPLYDAKAKLLVGQRQEPGVPINLQQNVEGLQGLTKTLTEAVGTLPIAETVAQQESLGVTPEDVLMRIKAQQVAETQFIELAYTDPDPEKARLLANATADVVSERISEVSPDVNNTIVTVWEPAAVPVKPVSPNLRLNVLVALMLGTVLGFASIFLVEYFSKQLPNKAPKNTFERPNTSSREAGVALQNRKNNKNGRRVAG